MIPLIRRLWTGFWFDEMKAARWARGFLLWAGAVAAQIAIAGVDAVATWDRTRWGIALGVAALTGAAGLITAGQRNPRPPSTPPPQAGFAQVLVLAFLIAVGWGIFLYALAHRGLP